MAVTTIRVEAEVRDRLAARAAAHGQVSAETLTAISRYLHLFIA